MSNELSTDEKSLIVAALKSIRRISKTLYSDDEPIYDDGRVDTIIQINTLISKLESHNQHTIPENTEGVESLCDLFGMHDKTIEVTLINPVRKGEYYTKGRLAGFKSGLFGGGHSEYKNGVPRSYSSRDRRWIKKPKVHVVYDIFEWGKTQISDWVDMDNCTFKIIEENSVI